MSVNTCLVESLLGSSQSQCSSDLPGMQGDIPRRKEEVGRLQRRVATFKGILTSAITGFISRVTYYESKHTTDDEVEQISTKFDYATDILKALERATERYIKLEHVLDEFKTLLSDTWDGPEDELETLISKHDAEFSKYEKNYLEMVRKNDATVERCKALLIKSALASQPQSENTNVTTETRPTGGAKAQLTFRPQPDLKPAFLAKDCSLIEFTTFTKAYIIYMNSAGTPIPREAVYSHLRVYVDPWWLVDLGWRGLDIHSDISQFSKVMDNTARVHFPIHARRMKVFSSSQKGDTMSFLREIVESIKMADWHTFNSEAAAMHVFMAFTRDEEAKKACYKILTELPQGDVRLLMTKISSIEAFPDNKPPISVKPVINNPEIKKKICTSCKYRGHLAPECWGRCEHCGRL